MPTAQQSIFQDNSFVTAYGLSPKLSDNVCSLVFLKLIEISVISVIYLNRINTFLFKTEKMVKASLNTSPKHFCLWVLAHVWSHRNIQISAALHKTIFTHIRRKIHTRGYVNLQKWIDERKKKHCRDLYKLNFAIFIES